MLGCTAGTADVAPGAVDGGGGGGGGTFDADALGCACDAGISGSSLQPTSAAKLSEIAKSFSDLTIFPRLSSDITAIAPGRQVGNLPYDYVRVFPNALYISSVK
jgi:hypothetical protein